MPRQPRPPKRPPRFFPAGEDAGLLDDEAEDSPEPLIEFGRRSAATPKEDKRGKEEPRPRRRRST